MIISAQTILPGEILPGVPYLITANGSDVVIEKRLEPINEGDAEAWVAIEGSPLANGTERILKTESHGCQIRVTPGAANTRFTSVRSTDH